MDDEVLDLILAILHLLLILRTCDVGTIGIVGFLLAEDEAGDTMSLGSDFHRRDFVIQNGVDECGLSTTKRTNHRDLQVRLVCHTQAALAFLRQKRLHVFMGTPDEIIAEQVFVLLHDVFYPLSQFGRKIGDAHRS